VTLTFTCCEALLEPPAHQLQAKLSPQLEDFHVSLDDDPMLSLVRGERFVRQSSVGGLTLFQNMPVVELDHEFIWRVDAERHP
jgi:hypothetical protein